ncbi:MAG TPA: PhnD/SsuA/transferrin family substrate-binding protein, partial [Modicisalibacter sp.]|nr:PhnD/SsuA/transferrin family substrate-binding protein [Modicisalibacter sp.]
MQVSNDRLFNRPLRLTFGALLAATLLPMATANAAECTDNGALAEGYCDKNGDLVADTPTDPDKLANPDTLVFAYTPVTDPSIYASIWEPFIEHVEEVTGKDVRFFAVQSNAAQIEAMRSGRLHIAGFSTGPTPFAVNLAGAV